MDLIVVESPTKARTLSRFLGSGFDLEATMGHIKDLPKSTLGVDIEKNFEPLYEPIAKKKDAVSKIKSKAKNAKNIYIATDPDREGEAIAFHVSEIINGKKNFRIVFHEITKEAVEEALKNPRAVNVNLVDAQVARRVLDRLVGYKLSPLLWKKVRRGLSAGRVQSVAVRLIVEREKEIESFTPQEYWDIFCLVSKKDSKEEFSVKLIKIGEGSAKITNEKQATQVVSDLKGASYKVSSVEKREVKKSPYPPFTTSTMTQAGARIFGWSAKKTMSLAQKLYEEGAISYHRTDSTFVAASALEKVRGYIKEKFGNQYLPASPRFYKTTSKVAQEAHEAVRPTDVNFKFVAKASRFGKDEETLYQLIWKRFVASQMKEALYDETVIEITALKYLLRASGQVIKFDGWKKVLPSKLDELGQITLPGVKNGEDLNLVKVDPQQKFTEAPARYTEASLIKTLEKLGIGRPSTYAPIISTIQIRNYVEKEEGKFIPTPVGVAVVDFLVANFPDIFDYAFTAEMEDTLDKIADGKNVWTDSIKKFWNPFNDKLTEVTKHSKRVKIEVEKLGKKCPTCKQGELVIRVGRFGKFISCSRFPDCKHTEKYVEKAGMKCPECGKGDVIVKKTRRGKRFFGCSRYPKCKWASWRNPKPEAKTQNVAGTP
ncbi:MAG: topoisomerase protein [Candidatus Woesebacteria bacterium GW2011_GWA1_45_8]|uniref:DNA topoisomerase 1 n=1 Tax=Candidatus Woesebacteria bacterium GW2011_GWA1_45_8 TaxID=1618559 RepID=A0A0G1MUZ7_9BACT|nr:MAG: topoisomerase protein [Candidatus Woesebacteria bacterium GW2011_GWA1_45_8]